MATIPDESTAVLLVDDKMSNLISLEGLLEAPHLNLVRALSGEEALEKALAIEPALIILDVQMPGMDGFEVARLLRGSSRTREIPIIFVTATHREEKFTFKGFESGAVDYLFKPLNPVIVRSKVNIFVELHKSRVKLNAALARMSLLNKELSTFAYSVSHDLRAPVRGVTWHANAILKDSGLSERNHSAASQIVSLSETMNRMIDGYLTLSQVTQSELALKKVNLADLARRIHGEMMLAQPDVQIAFTVPETVVAKGDPELLELALRNLIGNAWKYTAHADDPAVEFGVKEHASEMVYYITDNGVGYDSAYQDRLFGPFQRLHSSKEFEGTGIGLATVQRVIHRHGGRIWAESEMGKGASFYFTLQT